MGVLRNSRGHGKLYSACHRVFPAFYDLAFNNEIFDFNDPRDYSPLLAACAFQAVERRGMEIGGGHRYGQDDDGTLRISVRLGIMRWNRMPRFSPCIRCACHLFSMRWKRMAR